MILDRLLKHSEKLMRYRNVIKIGLVIAPFFLMDIRRTTSGVISTEPGYPYENSTKISNSLKSTELLFVNNRFILNDLPPRATLRIQGNPHQKTQLYTLISTLQAMKIRNINVIVDLNPLDRRSVYLFEIDLSFGDETCLWICPLKNHQPNSDLLLVAKKFFTSKLKLSLLDLLLSNSPRNNLEICLRPTREDLKTFVNFIRIISFIRSHPYGTYFYIPLEEAYIEANTFLPAIIPILTYYILDGVSTSYPVCIFRVLFGSLLYFICPLSSLLFLRRNEIQCFIVIFMALNFKVGLLYAALCYFRMVYDVFWIIVSALGARVQSPKPDDLKGKTTK